jgi:hypothetical protein
VRPAPRNLQCRVLKKVRSRIPEWPPEPTFTTLASCACGGGRSCACMADRARPTRGRIEDARPSLYFTVVGQTVGRVVHNASGGRREDGNNWAGATPMAGPLGGPDYRAAPRPTRVVGTNAPPGKRVHVRVSECHHETNCAANRPLQPATSESSLPANVPPARSLEVESNPQPPAGTRRRRLRAKVPGNRRAGSTPKRGLHTSTLTTQSPQASSPGSGVRSRPVVGRPPPCY